MADRRRLSMSELRSRTGIPPATIHHYLHRRLLPPPVRAAPNRFLYDDRHVEALRLIRILRRRRRLPLDTIRRILPDLVGLQDDQAFRPEMWDRVVGRRVPARRQPAARLLEEAVGAFSKRGYADVNVDELCRAAGLAKGSFYRHYRSKEDLFFAAARSAAAEVVEGFARSAGSTGVAPERAPEVLSGLMRPYLPLFLDLVSRALQGRAGYARSAHAVLGGLAADVGARLTIPGSSPEETGAAAVREALALGAATVFEPQADRTLLPDRTILPG